MAAIKGKGVPNQHTKGHIGDLYIDTNTGNRYLCTFSYSDYFVDGEYAWTYVGTTETTDMESLPESEEKTEEVKPSVEEPVMSDSGKSQNNSYKPRKQYHNYNKR